MPNFDDLFRGRGPKRLNVGRNLEVSDREALFDPERYEAPEDLVAAVNVALTLGMPLLITGEPGSGKSGVASRLRWELGLGDALLFHVIKSDTQARDLFYRFDTLGRFHAANTSTADNPGTIDPRRFIRFEAVGLALLNAVGPTAVDALLGPARASALKIKERKRCVVLIDEIDKAPRDVPNDILVEIERMRFEIPELMGIDSEDARHAGPPRVELTSDDDKAHKPIVIFTSNSERALPEPFIRRCVYHHLTLPPFKEPTTPNGVTILAIVERRIGDRYVYGKGLLSDAVELFAALREAADRAADVTRKPSLAELLDWLEALCLRWQDLAREAPLTLARIHATDPTHLEWTVRTLLLKREDPRAEEVGMDVLRNFLKQTDAG